MKKDNNEWQSVFTSDAKTSLRTQSVGRQVRMAVVLMSLMPALAFLYIGIALSDMDSSFLLPSLIVVACTGVAAICGWRILRTYLKNIVRLRQYVADIAGGTFTEPIHLYRSHESDDLRSIEESLNIILNELECRIKLVEDKLKVESGLRKALEQQHQVLLEAERHRVMLQSLGAACHYVGQPATALRLRLHLMRERASTMDELNEIDASIRDVEAIEKILRKLREVNEYRTEPYLRSGDSEGSQILAI